MEQGKFIGKIGAAFVRRWRITLLLLIAILTMGFIVYENSLPRDGFPTVQFPISSIQVVYFIDDPVQFDEQILSPIEDVILNEDYVESVNSSTNGNIGSLFVQFEQDLTSEEGTQLIEEKISQNVELPEQSQISFNPIKVEGVDGINDLLFAFYSESVDERTLDSKAKELAELLNENEQILEVNVNNLYEVRTNPATGEQFESKETFTRIGVQNDEGELVFFPAVNIGIIAAEDLSTLELSELVRGEIADILAKDDFEEFAVEFTGDLGQTVEEQIASLESNLIYGLIAVALVLVFFVNWRASIVAVIFIPTVLAATFLTMLLLGSTLNVISLFALVLGLGLLVDDAIVVIEAIDRNKRDGYKGIEAVEKSLREIGVADVLGTLTTILVFAPMLFITGVLGEFIKEFPRTIIITLSWSLIIALTIVPFLSNLLLRYKKSDEETNLLDKFNKFLDIPSSAIYSIGKRFGDFTQWTLSKWWISLTIILLSVGFIALGMFYGGKLFSERFNPFPPTADADRVSFSISFPELTPIETKEGISIQVEDHVSSEFRDEVTRYDYYFAGLRGVQGNLELTPMGERDLIARDIVDQLNVYFEDFEGAQIKFSVISAGPPTSDYPFLMQVYDADSEVLRSATGDISGFLDDLELENGKVTEVVVENVDTIANSNGRRYAEIKAKTSDPENTQLVLDIQSAIEEEYDSERLSELGLSEDALGFDLGQQSENLESFQSLGIIGIAALLLMYVLLVWQFNSFTQPLLVILLAIILGLPGVFMGLYLTGNYMSFLTAIGLIGLIGIVVNNTIMLVDFANQYFVEKDSPSEAMSEAIRLRFRPLVTTTLTTIVGLLPLALNDPFWEPISFTIMFGLISSTTMVLIAFPVYFVILERGRRGLKGLVEKVF